MTFSDCLMVYPNDTAAQSACWAMERCNYVQGFDFSCHWKALALTGGIIMMVIIAIWIYCREARQ